MTPIKHELQGKTLKQKATNLLFLVDDVFETEEKKILLSLLDDNDRRTNIGISAVGDCYEVFNVLKTV